MFSTSKFGGLPDRSLRSLSISCIYLMHKVCAAYRNILVILRRLNRI